MRRVNGPRSEAADGVDHRRNRSVQSARTQKLLDQQGIGIEGHRRNPGNRGDRFADSAAPLPERHILDRTPSGARDAPELTARRTVAKRRGEAYVDATAP